MATGNDKMVAVNVLVPRELRDALNRVAEERQWTLAVTVREAIKRLIAAEMPSEPSKARKR